MRPPRSTRCIGTVIVALTLVGTPARADEPVTSPRTPTRIASGRAGAVPPGHHVESETRTGHVVAGAVTFGLFYLPSCFFGAASVARSVPNDSLPLLFIPVAGPFAYVASDVHKGKQLFDGDTELMIVNGVAQAAGAAMFVIGLVGRDVIVKDADARIRVAPMLGTAATGVTASATF